MANNPKKYDVPSGAVRVTDLQQINPGPGEWNFKPWKQASASSLPTRDETGNKPNPFSRVAEYIDGRADYAGRKTGIMYNGKEIKELKIDDGSRSNLTEERKKELGEWVENLGQFEEFDKINRSYPPQVVS